MLYGNDEKVQPRRPPTLYDRLFGEHAVRVWTVISGMVAVLGLLITLIVVVTRDDSSVKAGNAIPQVPGSVAAPTPSPSLEPSAVPSPSPSISSPADSSDPDPLYLTEVPRKQFLREPAYSPQRSTATIGGQEFSPSYWFVFNNCGGCTYSTELNIKPVYRRFVGVVGLTDESRHDDVIDGVVHFSIYANDRLIFGPTRIEYPGKADFDVDVTGTTRIRLVVGDGTNYEYACWCGAKFTK
jgi:hypothetical protein